MASERAFQRLVDRAWAKMQADDPTVTREYVAAMLRLMWQMGRKR